MILYWNEVSETIFGTPINIDFYYITASKNIDGDYLYIGATPNTTFTHSYVGLFNEKMFYKVTAYVGTRQELDQYVDRYLKKPDNVILGNE